MFKRRIFPYNSIDKLGIASLISNIGFASVGTIWALYLDSIFHNASYVGFLISFFTIIGTLTYFFITPIIQKRDKIKLYLISLSLYTISYVLFATLMNIYAIIILGIIVAAAGSLRITCFGIIVRDKTKNSCVAKNEGLIYTSLNFAWLIGPLLAGFIADKYGIEKVFLFAAASIFLSLALFDIFKINDGRKCKKVDNDSLRIFIEFFRTKRFLKSYILSGGGNFWWALIYTYIPIYIVERGLDDMIVGYFLFAVVIPLIVSEYYFGKLAGKIGFKKMFIMGFSLLGLISIICFFISDIYWLLGFLVLASFCVAMIEPTTEAYFLDMITPSQRDKYYGAYSTSIDVNMFFATMAGAILLLFLPLKFVFVLFGAIMFIFVLISLSIKNIIENKRCK